MSTKLKESQAGSTQTFKAALTTLRNKSQIDIETILNDIFELKQEVKLLEKQRRQIRSLLLDLSYGLQEDCDRSAMRGKETASSAQLELLELEANTADGLGDGMRRNVTPMTMRGLTNDLPLSELDIDRHGHGLVSVVSSRRRDLENDNYFTGGNSRVGAAVIIGSSSSEQHTQQLQTQQSKKKLLVDKWLKQLQLHLNSDLGKAIRKALEITDPHLLSPPNSAATQPHSFSSEPTTPTVTPTVTQRKEVPAVSGATSGNKVTTKNIVPFESSTVTTREGGRSGDAGAGAEEWRRLSSEELRVSLTALECRSIWRKFQHSSAKYLSNSFQTSEAEWFHFIESQEKNKSFPQGTQQLSPGGQVLRNGITISLPNEGSIRHTFPLSRGSAVRFEDEEILKPTTAEDPAENIPRKFPSQESILVKGVRSFQDSQLFRRICLNAVTPLSSPFLSSPLSSGLLCSSPFFPFSLPSSHLLYPLLSVLCRQLLPTLYLLRLLNISFFKQVKLLVVLLSILFLMTTTTTTTTTMTTITDLRATKTNSFLHLLPLVLQALPYVPLLLPSLPNLINVVNLQK
jgi:hypothetical protein